MLSIEGKDQISALDDDMTTNRVNQFQQQALASPEYIYCISRLCRDKMLLLWSLRIL